MQRLHFAPFLGTIVQVLQVKMDRKWSWLMEPLSSLWSNSVQSCRDASYTVEKVFFRKNAETASCVFKGVQLLQNLNFVWVYILFRQNGRHPFPVLMYLQYTPISWNQFVPTNRNEWEPDMNFVLIYPYTVSPIYSVMQIHNTLCSPASWQQSTVSSLSPLACLEVSHSVREVKKTRHSACQSQQRLGSQNCRDLWTWPGWFLKGQSMQITQRYS